MSGRSSRRPSIGPEDIGAEDRIPDYTELGGDVGRAGIDVTAMIDVMLALLIIFMVVTPALTRYAATPPHLEQAVPTNDPRVVTLEIDAGGGVSIDAVPVPRDNVGNYLETLYARRGGERRLLLRADSAASYEVVRDALSNAAAVGVRTVGAVGSVLDRETGDTHSQSASRSDAPVQRARDVQGGGTDGR